ncbi:MAG: hypothetical protein ABSH26_18265 [Opitutaceae bacterium]|jgi:hypothetical protein
MQRNVALICTLLSAGRIWGQTPQPAPNPAQVDSPDELQKLKNTCGAFTFAGLSGCVEELFTGHPLHIAVGSIAPQNGFGAGLAYIGAKNTDNWRITWDADAVASNNASWRAGVYVNFVHSGGGKITFHKGTKDFKSNLSDLPEHTVFSLYAQSISLNKLTYFGLGPTTSEAGRSFYGMMETIVGGHAVKPVYEPWKISLYGEVNGRFVNLRASNGQPSPSIGQLYTESTAPGLTTQPGTLQFGEGIRMTPVLAKDYVRLNYSATYQEYIAAGSSFSFQRLTFDIGHQFALYGKTTRILTPRSGNGPDDCSLDPGVKNSECPAAFTRNLEGSFGLRLLNVLSMTPGGDTVPFYYQPTMGGSDIDGDSSLASYQDYRFRAPNLLLVRESFEHSVGKWPIGVVFMADEVKLGLRRGDLGAAPWLHSFSTGLTLRAGGFPEVFLLFAFGGHEGTHTVANVNTSLLGGSVRPSLY